MAWLPRWLKGREAMEIMRLREEENMPWAMVAEQVEMSRQGTWRRRRWLEENYLLRAGGLGVHWNGRPQRLQPNTGVAGYQRKVKLPVPPGVHEPRPLPVFEVDPVRVVEDEIRLQERIAFVLGYRWKPLGRTESASEGEGGVEITPGEEEGSESVTGPALREWGNIAGDPRRGRWKPGDGARA